MKNTTYSILALSFLLSIASSSFAQIETRLATYCAVESVQVPINIKNLEQIKSFQLKLIFDKDLLKYDTSLYHFAKFEEDNDETYKIHVVASNDTISITWNYYNTVSVQDNLLLSLSFTEIGSGNASFNWLVDECYYKNINGLSIDANYSIDGMMAIPFNSAVDISFEQFTKGCRDDSESGGCKAQAEVYITGGQAPYAYNWNDKFSQNESIAIGLCQDPVSVVIKDSLGCYYASIFDPEIYPASVYDIRANPEEVFISTPYVDFSIETDDEYIETYLWEFGDETSANTDMVNHTYAKVGNYMVSLRTENIDGCDTTVSMPFEVKELNFCIPNVFTPNGDGINDTWVYKILGAESGSNEPTGFSEVEKCSGDDLIFDEHFKSSYLVVMNRSGRTVYECTNCSEYWDGSGLPDGVYFYVFTWEGEYSNGKEQGNVTILNGQ